MRLSRREFLYRETFLDYLPAMWTDARRRCRWYARLSRLTRHRRASDVCVC